MLQEAERLTKAAHPDSIDLATFCLYAGFVGDRLAAVPVHSGSRRRSVRRYRSRRLSRDIRGPPLLAALPAVCVRRWSGKPGGNCSRPSHALVRKVPSSSHAAPQAGEDPPLLSHRDPPGQGGLTGIGRRASAISLAALWMTPTGVWPALGSPKEKSGGRETTKTYTTVPTSAICSRRQDACEPR